MPDGNRAVPDQTLFDALDRQTLKHEVKRVEKTPYLVFDSKSLKLRKTARTEIIQFQSS